MMIAVCLAAISLLTCLSPATAQAPGDHDEECRTGPNSDNHIFPAEWRVLVDTYDYINLFNSFISFPLSAWTVNDVDGDSQGWAQFVGSDCNWEMRTCSPSEDQDNWLISQFVSYLGANEVIFNITYRFAECFSFCTRPYVTLFRYDTDQIANHGERINPGNYQPLFDSIEASRLEHPAGDLNPSLNLIQEIKGLARPANRTGFYLGLRDEGTCGTISRIIAYYVVCPARVENLVSYPETAVPVRNSSDIIFNAHCVSNSHNITTLEMIAFSDNSTCSPVADGGAMCECDGGYVVLEVLYAG